MRGDRQVGRAPRRPLVDRDGLVDLGPDLEQMIERGAPTDDRLLRLRAGLPSVGGVGGVERELRRGQAIPHPWAQVEHAEVRRDDLVGAEDRHVDAHPGHVGQLVGRGVHQIHHHPGAGSARDRHRLRHRRARAEGVRGRREGHDAGTRTQQLLEVLRVQGAERRPRAPGPHDHPARRQGTPRIDVRVVIERRHHDLVAGGERIPDRAGEEGDQGGRVGTEGDVPGPLGPQERRRPRTHGLLVGGHPAARRVRSADVDLQGGERLANGVDHAIRQLRAGGVVEVVDLAGPEGGEATADPVDLVGGHVPTVASARGVP